MEKSGPSSRVEFSPRVGLDCSVKGEITMSVRSVVALSSMISVGLTGVSGYAPGSTRSWNKGGVDSVGESSSGFTWVSSGMPYWAVIS